MELAAFAGAFAFLPPNTLSQFSENFLLAPDRTIGPDMVAGIPYVFECVKLAERKHSRGKTKKEKGKTKQQIEKRQGTSKER